MLTCGRQSSNALDLRRVGHVVADLDALRVLREGHVLDAARAGDLDQLLGDLLEAGGLAAADVDRFTGQRPASPLREEGAERCRQRKPGRAPGCRRRRGGSRRPRRRSARTS